MEIRSAQSTAILSTVGGCGSVDARNVFQYFTNAGKAIKKKIAALSFEA